MNCLISPHWNHSFAYKIYSNEVDLKKPLKPDMVSHTYVPRAVES